MFTDEDLMFRAIRLAKNGIGTVSPNPLVGCVIVKDGRIIGEGYHEKFGGPHAEVNAVRSAAESVEGADVYVNLEPCSIHGKTPPCADFLVEKRVRKVFVAMLDPNPLVNGGGVKRLRDAGIEVDIGIGGEVAARLNEAFAKFIVKKIPFVVLKAAQSIDGKIALANGRSKYITSAESIKRVHELRATYDSVLVGAGTVRTDDPQLTVRFAEGRSPKKIILDGRLTSPPEARVFRGTGTETLVFYSARLNGRRGTKKKLSILESKGVRAFSLPSRPDGRIGLMPLMRKLADLGMASVMVEGGSEVFSEFISAGLVDKFHIFLAPRILGGGKTISDGFELKSLSKSRELRNVEFVQLGPDILITAYPAL